MEAYTIKIDAFEGPFDLLFHLIEKNKFDIYDIPISLIADQYLDYVTAMQEMDLDIASEFLVMASTLMHIKSRLLLPVSHDEEEGDVADPRDELVVSILEYRKYKEFTASLREMGAYWGEARYRPAGVFEGAAGGEMPRNWQQQNLIDIDQGRLLSVYRGMLDTRRRSHENINSKVKKIIEREHVTMAKKVMEIISYLSRKPRFLFQKLYNAANSTKLEIIVGFNALLELSLQNRVTLRQKKQFGGLLVINNRQIQKNK